MVPGATVYFSFDCTIYSSQYCSAANLFIHMSTGTVIFLYLVRFFLVRRIKAYPYVEETRSTLLYERRELT
jgi:hypothetical protein